MDKISYLKNYKKDLKEFTDFKTNGYFKKSYILKCYDENKKTTHILISIYYTHCIYELYLEGLHIEETENGGKIWHFTECKPIKLTMSETTYKLSHKQIEKAENFLFLNLHSLLNTFTQLNNNLYLEV